MSNNRFESLLKKFEIVEGDSFATNDGVCVIQKGDARIVLAIHIHDCDLSRPRDCLVNFSNRIWSECHDSLVHQEISLDEIVDYFEYQYVVINFVGVKIGLLSALVSDFLHLFETRVNFYRVLDKMKYRIKIFGED